VSDKISRYYELKPTGFRDLVSMSIAQRFSDAGVMEQVVELTLARRIESPDDNLDLIFVGVRDLRFSQPTLSLISIPLLNISKTDLGYRVSDEEGYLQFNCRDFSTR
jgi:hypothetical protein